MGETSKLALIYIVFQLPLFAQAPETNVLSKEAILDMETRKEEYVLDDKNRVAGKNLIYDCKREHFLCVDEETRENCKTERAYADRTAKSNLACAFFKQFPTKKDCVLEQYKMMEKKIQIFCFKKRQ